MTSIKVAHHKEKRFLVAKGMTKDQLDEYLDNLVICTSPVNYLLPKKKSRPAKAFWDGVKNTSPQNMILT